MNSVGDIGANTRVLCQTVSWVGRFFLKLLPKIRRKLILFRATKRIQVSGHMHFKNVLYFTIGIFQFKVILNLFPEQIQKCGLNSVNILCENLAY